MRRLFILAAAVSACAAAGCIRVQAPDKPIEINLNVNIRQEVIVRLEREADDLLRDNPDLF
ncbi:MAG: YnbE family lipoprotein [Hyphomonadaceae bacterium]|nr:YnbE family lipoprotein [Hyphomonadaceae bacterium]